MLMRGANKGERKGIRERGGNIERGERERERKEGRCDQQLRFGNRAGCVLFDLHTQIVNRLKLNAA